MEKAYKAEFTLGLIGSIIGIIVFVIMLVVGVIVGVLGAAAYMYGMGGGLIALAIFGVILSLVAFILGFVGTGKLNKNDKSGGILLIVAGGLSFISIFVGGWYAIFTAALLLTGGIMAVAKKPPTVA
ncbi:MAG: DUF4064 domain-containing protein [Eubacteriales bacterium]|nr:DUF4064 domain-containing protein [Eubacteriales bacterium]